MALKASAILVTYVLLSVVSTIFIYCLSLYLGHVDPLLPFFSDIGDQPVESTVFTQCFVLDAAVLMLVVQVRFVYVTQMLERRETEEAQPANRAGLYAGYAAATGLFVVACFQESHAYFAHYLALLVYFVSSIVYFGIHADISKSLNSLAILRTILTLLMCIFFVSFFVGYLVAMALHKKPWTERHHWGKNDGGWTSHLVSASSEWLLMALFQAYVLTFYKDFHQVMLTKTRIIVLAD